MARFKDRRGIVHPVNGACEAPFMLVELTKSQFAMVDKEHFEAVNAFNWCAEWDENTQSFYAKRSISRNGKQRMHVFIGELVGLDLSGGRTVDHIEHDTLDNRSANLRSATKAEQNRNRRKQSNNASGLIGVSYDKERQKWQVKATVEGIEKKIGRFDNPNEAALARDFAERLNYSEFSQFNFDGGWLS